ncbi:MAG: nucleoside kinase [Clostridiales bacterium]|nr:nucleoside kinase [Clostridiales bacterium]
MNLNIQGHQIEPKPGQTLLELIRELGLDADRLSERPLACDLGGEVFNLNYVPLREKDKPQPTSTHRMRRAIAAGRGKAKLIYYAEERGMRVYERTLLFVFFLAMRELYPGVPVRINHAIGSGIYITAEGLSPTRADAEAIAAACRRIVAADLPLRRQRMDIEDTIELFAADGQEDKVRLLAWRNFAYFDVYRHGDYVDYFYGEMAPSTGYAQVFDIIAEGEGLFLLRPRKSSPDNVEPFNPMPKFAGVFIESDKWGRLMRCETIADLNDRVAGGGFRELIRVNEALHEKRFSEIAGQIHDRGAKLTLIAGPSSSGKTTSAHRLSTQLRVLGHDPILLSLDDYYIDRHLIAPDENGEIDLEHINTIDVPRFNRDIEALLAGEEVETPRFSFLTARREPEGRLLKLRANTVLVVEGLHALNPTLLLPRIDPQLVYRMYVSALTTLNLDNHNRIPSTDIRLLRRLVRDHETRGASVERTLNMWDSVRRGEGIWIFPYQESADAIFNTALVYELAVLKGHIYPLLQSVQPTSPCYDDVQGILKFLNYIRESPILDEIPPTSILREFVGGNTFYRK